MSATEAERAPLLAIRLGALGDMIMFLPVLEALFRKHGCQIDVITSGPWSEAVLEHSPHVRRISTLPTTKAFPALFSPTYRRLVKQLRTRAIDHLYVFESVSKADHLIRRAKVPSDKVHHAKALAADSDGREHQTDYHLRLVDRAAKATVPRLNHNILPVAATRQWLSSIGVKPSARIVLMQPGNKRTMRRGRASRQSNLKYWPEKNWIALAKTLTSKDPHCRILVCGAPSENELAGQIALGSGCKRVHAVANALPLRRLFALATLADAMISVDTGPAHVAAAAGCPLVVMYGKTNPVRYAPRGIADVNIVHAHGKALKHIEIGAVETAYHHLKPRPTAQDI